MSKIIETIEKLMRHSESAKSIGSIAEAEAFAVQARKLMTEHKVEMHEINLTGELEGEQVEQCEVFATDFGQRSLSKIAVNQLKVATALAPAYYCLAVGLRGCNNLVVFGLKSDRERFVQALDAILATAAALCQRDLDGAYNAGRNFRASWYHGFAIGLHEKVQSELAREKQESSSTALVVIKSAMDKVKEAASQSNGKNMKSQANTSDMTAKHLGYRAAMNSKQLD